MCGIFGIVTDSEVVPDRARLGASMQSLVHRGPNSQKVHAGPGAGFAHTRLSFVDVDARSDQPFWDTSGRYALIFNGEIYNYRQLRAQLESEGVVFRTTSDTEVLLQMLLHRDPDTAIRALEGMFAFALWDGPRQRLVLARDRFGKKPMFIAQTGSALVVESFGDRFGHLLDMAPGRIIKHEDLGHESLLKSHRRRYAAAGEIRHRRGGESPCPASESLRKRQPERTPGIGTRLQGLLQRREVEYGDLVGARLLPREFDAVGQVHRHLGRAVAHIQGRVEFHHIQRS